MRTFTLKGMEEWNKSNSTSFAGKKCINKHANYIQRYTEQTANGASRFALSLQARQVTCIYLPLYNTLLLRNKPHGGTTFLCWKKSPIWTLETMLNVSLLYIFHCIVQKQQDTQGCVLSWMTSAVKIYRDNIISDSWFVSTGGLSIHQRLNLQSHVCKTSEVRRWHDPIWSHIRVGVQTGGDKASFSMKT